MLEIIYHGGKSIELFCNKESLLCDNQKSQCLAIGDHNILYLCDLDYGGEIKQFDVIFVEMHQESSIEEILSYIAQFATKYVVPMYIDSSVLMTQRLQDFARRVMLDNYGVPKVLKQGQMIVV